MAKTYETYKDSGIAWIGEIPSEWEVCRLKNTVKCLDYRRQPVDSGNRESGIYPYWGAGSIQDYVNDYIFDEEIVLLGEDGAPFFDSHRPVSFYVNEKVWVNNHIHVLKPNQIVQPRFLVYYLNSVEYKQYINGSILNKLTQSNMNEISIVLPSMKDQRSIATFLDTKCGEIDALISLQEEMISELQAYKQSVITEAVTKGLNPNAKMKDSGVEWIGEIPEEWNSAKLKNIIAFIESGVSVNAGLEDVGPNDVGVLKTSSVSRNVFMPQECKKVFDNEINRVSCPVTANTIIVSRMNTPELVGACGYVDRNYDNIFLPDRLWQVHFENNVIVKYYWYYLISKRIKNYFSSLSSGTSSSMQNISQPQFLNAPISIPPLPEQHSIATYLDEKTSQIDSLISLKQQKIEELKDYKKSIIYEYVTGKKRV